MRIACAVALVVLLGCGGSTASSAEPTATSGGESAGNQNAPAPAPYAPPPSPLAPASSGPLGDTAHTSHEQPLRACGPSDSYRRVAEHRCPDGSVPLGGDPGAGAGARVGNVGPNASGHIIDLYRVPCASGEVDVYVDMYGCPEMERLLGP